MPRVTVSRYAPRIIEVWYNLHSMVNILSFGEVAQRFRITMDTAVNKSIKVHLDDNTGRVLCFNEMESGLYMLDANSTNDFIKSYSYLNVGNQNIDLYTKQEIGRAQEARQLYKHINMPGYNRFIRLVEKNYLEIHPSQLKTCGGLSIFTDRKKQPYRGAVRDVGPRGYNKGKSSMFHRRLRTGVATFKLQWITYTFRGYHCYIRCREEVTSLEHSNQCLRTGQIKPTYHKELHTFWTHINLGTST